jgi:hypothetical protein
MSPAERLALLAAANRAPSVHNIQPTRFLFEDERTILVLEDERRRLFVGDPQGKDNQKSIGAAVEGVALALSEQGLGVEVAHLPPSVRSGLREIARLRLITGAARDDLAAFADARASYRGKFVHPIDSDRATLSRLAASCPDLRIVEETAALAHVAAVFDATSMEVLRDNAYRAELLSWMRLSRSHPDYARDGLNAAHMALSPIEALGAGIVLGSAFTALDKMGLAGPAVAEGAKVRSAAGLALFHRPVAEAEFDTGRRFYRVWLEIERAGLALAPMSVLADAPRTAEALMREFGIGADRKLVSVFRIGRRPRGFIQPVRARLPALELLAR